MSVILSVIVVRTKSKQTQPWARVHWTVSAVRCIHLDRAEWFMIEWYYPVVYHSRCTAARASVADGGYCATFWPLDMRRTSGPSIVVAVRCYLLLPVSTFTYHVIGSLLTISVTWHVPLIPWISSFFSWEKCGMMRQLTLIHSAWFTRDTVDDHSCEGQKEFQARKFSNILDCSDMLWFRTFYQLHCICFTATGYTCSSFDNFVFTTLHEMQTRTSDENSVCLPVCQTRDLWQNERNSDVFRFSYERSLSLVFWEEEWVVGATPSTWNFVSTGPRWSEIADFEPIVARSASAVTPSEKSRINTNRKSTTRFYTENGRFALLRPFGRLRGNVSRSS